MRRATSRELVHRGALDAIGLRLDVALLGEAEARRRVLLLWTPGLQVRRLTGALLLRLPVPLRLVAEQAPGLPFAEQAGRCVSAPLPADRLLTLPPGAWAEVRGGQLTALPPGEPEDVAGWLDLDALTIVETHALGAPPQRPAVAAAPTPPEARVLLGQPRPSAEARETLQELVRGRAAPRPAGWLLRLLARVSGRAGPAGTAPAQTPWLRRTFDRIAVNTALGRLLGERHARHLRRMIDLFETGNLGEALRHAVPLSGAEGEGEGRLAWSIPAPRSSLEIGGPRGPAAVSPISGPDVHAYLRRLYREAFTRLEAQGRIEEAAFVLAELLGADAEAVAFLERHGRLRLAAELAETRGLSPAIAVRLWLLAGETERAVALARRTRSFADAVLRLERARQAEPAAALRLLWADDLARAGDYTAAVDVAGAVPRGRGLVRAWLELALEQGGAAAGRALVRRLELAPELRDDTRRRIGELLLDPEAVAARLALAQALCGLRGAEAQAAARPTVRALLADAGRGESIPRATFDGLVDLAGDAALRADLPAWPSPAPVTGAWLVTAAETGTLPVEDVAFLPSGRTLLALGEAGARLLSREGRTIAHLDQPAHRLVLSPRGDQAIALSPRGELWRLSRLDLARRTARFWCDAPLDAWASRYDGATWFVAQGGDLVGVDAHAPRLDGPWGVRDVGEVRAIAADEELLSLAVHADGLFQAWTYDVASRRLRSREEVSAVWSGPPAKLALAPAGLLVSATPQPGDLGCELVWSGAGGAKSRGLPFLAEPLLVAGQRVALAIEQAAGTGLLLVDLPGQQEIARIELPGARRATAGFDGRLLAVGDDRGRVLVLDLDRREVLRRLRT